MSKIVSHNQVDITIEIVDAYIQTIPDKTIRKARDYLYEDRLVRKIHMPGHLIAELRGYQDVYIPHFELSDGLWQGGCTCNRAMSCSHIAALLLSFRAHREHFVFPPYALYCQLQNSWPLLYQSMPGLTLLKAMPESPPWWMLERQIAQAQLGKFAPFTIDELERIIHHPATVSDLHPSWLQDESIQTAIKNWQGPRIIRKPGLTFWLNLWSFNPYLPLDHILALFALEIEQNVPLILQQLWSPPPVPFPMERHWQRIHRLLFLLEQNSSVPIIWLWDQLDRLDPLHLARAHALLRQHGSDQAIHYLEQHWPEHPQDQHTVRQTLISWLPSDKSLPFRVADCLETGSQTELRALKTVLDPGAFRDLVTVFNHRWASSAEP